jgi:hypothetical protein
MWRLLPLRFADYGATIKKNKNLRQDEQDQQDQEEIITQGSKFTGFLFLLVFSFWLSAIVFILSLL